MPYADPEKERKRGRRKYQRRKKIIRQQYRANPEPYIQRARTSRLKIRYGLSLEALDALYQAQNGRCAICGKTEDEAREVCKKDLHVDHCHTTGRVRGLLCMKCNGGLGMFYDSVEMLERALAYLKGK